ncbi:MAG: 4-(cytidine 5'-diphospho)-2-C-methyl-D-erythritol kinase [Pseudomonadota bacterium]
MNDIQEMLHDEVCNIRTGCKVNVNLYITGTLENGYHTLDSIFIPLQEPHDMMRISCGTDKDTGITVECTVEGIDVENNTLTKSYELYAKVSNYAPTIHVILEKGVPHGAGLGGGSADAAGLLRYLNERNPDPLSHAQLLQLASKIGADVPFFLMDGPCHASGIGEILSPVQNTFAGMHLLLVCPSVHVNTAWAYAAWDKEQKRQFSKPSTLTTQGQLGKTPFAHTSWLFNSFETVVFKTHPQLHALKEFLLREGAAGAVMSGSGSALFALFRTESAAVQVQKKLALQGQKVYQHIL